MAKLKGYIKHNNKMIPVCDNDSLSVGMIMPYASNGDIPVGWLLCNGASIGKNTYPALFSVIGYTYGGSGDYFNLPNLTDKFIEGGVNAGENKEAGLPNIEGLSGLGVVTSFDGLSGAFSINQATSTIVNGVSVGTANSVKIDASRSNAIYGNSDTVQPPALTMRYIIKAFGGATGDVNDITVTNLANDIANVSSDLNKKFGENDFAILQVNDGNNVSVNSRYVLDNPFPNYYIHCVVELYYNNTWFKPNFMYDNGHHWGTIVDVNNNQIIVRTMHELTSDWVNTIQIALLSAPCRVKVWKVGKIQ